MSATVDVKNFASDLTCVSQIEKGVDGLIRMCRMHKNRCVKTRQLHNGIGDTLVLAVKCWEVLETVAGGSK